MKKALPCDTTPLRFPPCQGGKEGGYGPPAQNGNTLTMSLPSGEYRPKQSRHCKVFSAPLPRRLYNHTFFDRVTKLLHVRIHRQLAENNIRLRPVRMFEARFIQSGFLSDDFLAANGLTRPITSSWFLMWWWIKKAFVFSYCILVDGKAAGFIGLHNKRPCAVAEMSLALFEKDMRRKGYGSRAFHLFVHDLEKHRLAGKIVVRVNKDNLISLSFWKKLGFEEVKREDGLIILLYAARLFQLSPVKRFP